ncbi:hypothetical protein [Acidisphaera sp. S103]|uniref:hypothetical protein n=1 Tax=Acidisphaera sp. S103 TaxID=1747223 RepID=UPI00131B384C|nr:hypothetical protein [Acidisphaera sp. S103]
MTDESDPSKPDQLPALVSPTAAISFTTVLPEGALIPSMVAEAGESAAWRYVDFFTSNIRNPNTRRAYSRACQTFLRPSKTWGENRTGISARCRFRYAPIRPAEL